VVNFFVLDLLINTLVQQPERYYLDDVCFSKTSLTFYIITSICTTGLFHGYRNIDSV
jgi:hypothetical protein